MSRYIKLVRGRWTVTMHTCVLPCRWIVETVTRRPYGDDGPLLAVTCRGLAWGFTQRAALAEAARQIEDSNRRFDDHAGPEDGKTETKENRNTERKTIMEMTKDQRRVHAALKAALDELGLGLFPWDGPDPNDTDDVRALAERLGRELDGHGGAASPATVPIAARARTGRGRAS